jgi:hypothetical protein
MMAICLPKLWIQILWYSSVKIKIKKITPSIEEFKNKMIENFSLQEIFI